MKENVCKICRRAGDKLFLKGERCLTAKCGFIRRSYGPGMHGQKRRRRISDYGRQLAEKQKARAIYGVSEEQFKNYYKKAAQSKESTMEKIIEFLERRLDNTVYRLGFASSRKSARQLVSHGKVLINNKKVDIASYLVSKKEQIKVEKEQIKDKEIPSWLSYDRKKKIGKVESLPAVKTEGGEIDFQLIVEYYSK